MKLLAIDPGPVRSAWLHWNDNKIGSFGIDENAAVLQIARNAQAVNEADILAIEKIASYGMAVGAEVFETCVWTGRFMEAWLGGGRTESAVLRISRLEIKLHHCHSPKANDSNIRQALIDRMGPPGTKKQPGATFGVSKDVWAALALAICVVDREESL